MKEFKRIRQGNRKLERRIYRRETDIYGNEIRFKDTGDPICTRCGIYLQLEIRRYSKITKTNILFIA